MLQWQQAAAFAAWLPRLESALATHPPQGLTEPVFGFQSMLLVFQRPTTKQAIQRFLNAAVAVPLTSKASTPVKMVEVSYDGPDLVDLATAKSCSVDAIVQRHCAPVYTVHCLGFSPGFPYLGPLDPFLWTPRKPNPRKHIRPGAVAIGGSHTGIYSIASPGGWHWIGHTALRCFNSEQATAAHPNPEAIFTFKPGDRLRFVPVRL